MATIAIYTHPACGDCGRATELLTAKGVSFREFHAPRPAGVLPQIAIGRNQVSGLRELLRLERTGELDLLLGVA